MEDNNALKTIYGGVWISGVAGKAINKIGNHQKSLIAYASCV